MKPPDNHLAPTTDGGTFKTDIVNNIPLQQAAPAAPAHEDHELDKIMHDVGQQLTKEDHKPAKKHHLFGKRQPKSEPKLVAQPLGRHQIVNMDVLPLAPQPHHEAKPAASPAHHPAAKAQAAPKKPKQHSAPVMVILLTVIVTGILIAAAISAYK